MVVDIRLYFGGDSKLYTKLAFPLSYPCQNIRVIFQWLSVFWGAVAGARERLKKQGELMEWLVLSTYYYYLIIVAEGC